MFALEHQTSRQPDRLLTIGGEPAIPHRNIEQTGQYHPAVNTLAAMAQGCSKALERLSNERTSINGHFGRSPEHSCFCSDYRP